MKRGDPARRSAAAFAAALALGSTIAWPSACLAQAITADGSLGTVVGNGGDAYSISGGTLKGTNLFHSFGQFSVPTAGSATFNGPIDTQNVLSRVTGGSPSSIDGLVSTRGGASPMPSANFFLINPAGVIFGPSASLDVGGAFRVSTADNIRLADGVLFSAIPGMGDALLSAAAPHAFGFLSSNPAPITLDGSVLLVDPGQILSLVGGNVQMNGAVLLAPSGLVEIGSAASQGVATFDSGLDMSQFPRLGDVRITGGGIAVGDGFSPGGTIVIRSGQLIVEAAAIMISDTADLPGAAVGIDILATESIIVSDGSLIQTLSAGQADASDLSIRTGNLTVTGVDPNNGFSSTIESQALFSGKTGTVNLQVGSAQIADGGLVRTVAQVSSAGDVKITATGTVTVSGVRSEISSDTFGTSDPLVFGGNIEVTAADVVVRDRGTIRSGDPGAGSQAGQNVNITASNSVSLSGFGGIQSWAFQQTAGTLSVSAPRLAIDAGYISTSTLGGGNAGAIAVSANTVSLVNGAQIASSSENVATGNGGTITVNASDSLGISGTRADTGVSDITFTRSQSSGVFSSTRSGSGNAGQISISTPTLTVTGGGTISVATRGTGSAGAITANVGNFFVTGGSRIDSSTTGGGVGGAMMVNGSVSISGAGSGFFSTASSTGNAGAITVAGPALLLADAGRISVTTDGAGNAGTILTNVGTLSITGGARLDSSSSGAGAGGAINVNAASQVEISGGGSVRADSLGAGNTGSITIAAGDRIMMEGGSVSTRAATADGGNITLMAPNVIRLNDSQVTTSVQSGTGSGGNIFIDPEFVILQGTAITANAFGGPGGNITIVANNFIADATSSVQASSALSTPGSVEIQSPDNNLASDLAQLPKELVDASRLMQSACSARRAGASSSFTVAGRGGVPVDPDGYLPSYSMSEAPAAAAPRAGHGFMLAMAGSDCWR